MPPLEYTGERMVPEASDEQTFWQHIYRYHFATRYVRQKDVLDVACGEGYGSASLARAGARSVIGLDIDPVSVAHAKDRYGVDARVCNAEQLDLPNSSVDTVVSFETIEHLNDQRKFIRECGRVLRSNGVLVISSPNRETYGADTSNPYHTHEMTGPEFRDLLSETFPRISWFAQKPTISHWAWPNTYVYLRGPLGRIVRTGAKLLQPLLNPGFATLPTSAQRNDPVTTILRSVRPGAGLFNPNIVTKTKLPAHEHPYFFVAVARKGS